MKLDFMTTDEKYSKTEMKAKSKSPAFQFYPKDFLSDITVSQMTHEERGIYITLLCHDWIEDGISSNQFKDWFNVSSSLVQRCFVDHPTKEGFVTNPRLLKERQKQKEWSAKSSEAGKKSGISRKIKNLDNEPTLNGGLVLVEPDGNSTSTSTFTSTSTNKHIRTRRKKLEIDKQSFGRYQHVKIHPEDYQALLTDLGDQTLESLITDLDGYIEAKGVSYRNHAAAIRNWHRRKTKESKQVSTRIQPDGLTGSYERILKGEV